MQTALTPLALRQDQSRTKVPPTGRDQLLSNHEFVRPFILRINRGESDSKVLWGFRKKLLTLYFIFPSWSFSVHRIRWANVTSSCCERVFYPGATNYCTELLLYASHVLVLLWMTGQEGIYCTALTNIPFLLASINEVSSWFHVEFRIQQFSGSFFCFYLMENMLEFIYSTCLCFVFIDLFSEDIFYFIFLIHIFF